MKFSLTINKKKSPYWIIVKRDGTSRTFLSTKKTIKSEAQKVLRGFVQIRDEEKLKLENISLELFFNDYKNFASNSKSPHYLRSISTSFRMFQVTTGNLQLKNITPRICERFIYETYSRSKHASLLYYRTLKSAFTKAVEWDYISTNPFKKFKAPKIPKSFPEFINDDQLELIIQKVKKTYLVDYYYTAKDTGLRAGELCAMKWTWIDFDSKTITVKHTDGFISKGKKERIVPMTERVYQILTKKFRKSRNPTEPVFYRILGIPLTVDHSSRIFAEARKEANISDEISLHSLRHSFASELVCRNVNLSIVKELLGHEDIKTTMIYSHVRPTDLIKAINTLNNNKRKNYNETTK